MNVLCVDGFHIGSRISWSSLANNIPLFSVLWNTYALKYDSLYILFSVPWNDSFLHFCKVNVSVEDKRLYVETIL